MSEAARLEGAGRGLAARVRGEGESVLWVHGYTLDGGIWDELWDLLPGWRHVGIDLPGHGASDPVAPGEDLPALARRLAALAAAEGVRHVVAISFGGMIGLQLALEMEGLQTLVLGSPGIGGGPRDPAAQTRNLELARLYRTRGVGPWLAELWMTSPPDIFRGAEGHPELWRRLRETVERHRWDELGSDVMRGISDHPQPLASFRRIRARTAVFVGEEDMPTFKRCAELLRQAIPGCERIRVPGAGHLALLEEPRRLAPAVAAALRGQPIDPP
jgi:pimeloyl-ACP methyl ester carboxylesterase